MPFTLTDLRADLDALLGSAIDAATWTSALKDEGARRALDRYTRDGPIHESAFTVTEAGREQDLSAIAGLAAVESVAGPWAEGDRFAARALPWRLVNPPARILLETAALLPGELLRVRYRRSHTLSGLDGAAATTVPDAHRSLLALGAAAAAARVRLRQLGENPALPHTAAAALEQWCARAEADFAAGLDALSAERGVRWEGVGL